MVAVGEKQSRGGSSPYQFKPSPYSSHALALRCFPSDGRGRRVLDLGCGSGEIDLILAGAGYQLIGIDKTPPVSSEFPAAPTFLVADLDGGLPHLAGTFDFVLCADFLEHLREPEKLLGELKTVLAPEGRLVASLPNSGNLYFRLNVLAGRFPAHDCGLFDRTHLHFYTWAGWVHLFAGAGFQIERVTSTAVPVGLALRRWEHFRLVRWLEAGCYALARLWKKLFAYQFIVVARAGRTA